MTRFHKDVDACDIGQPYIQEIPTMPSYPQVGATNWSPTGVVDGRRLDTLCDVQNGYVYLFGDIDEDMARDIVSGVLEMIDMGLKEIVFYINSYGGEAPAANTILDVILMAKEVDIHIVTYAMGACCSGGTVAFLAGDERLISERCFFLMHEAQLYVEDNTTNVMADSKTWDSITKSILKIVIPDTEVDIKFVMDHIKGKDWVVTPQQCKKYGFAHNYITKGIKKCQKKKKTKQAE